MMDEVQELATVDPASGLSDATFWNVARSTGVAGVFATQTVAALTQAMGKDAAENFMQQARSKIFLRSEDQATVSYACWLAGEFERSEEHTSELQSLMRISYAVFCLKKKKIKQHTCIHIHIYHIIFTHRHHKNIN